MLSVIYCIVLSFVLAFIILYFFLNSNTATLKTYQDVFFGKDFGNEKKIIILGSSHVGHLNATYITQYIMAGNKDAVVYNLAIVGDRPQQRLGSIEKIISIKPDLVIYGIGYRDFISDDMAMDQGTKVQNLLPSPQEFFRNIIRLNLLTGYDLNFFQSPKAVTLRVLHEMTSPPNGQSKIFNDDTPFFHPTAKDIILNLSPNLKEERRSILQSFRSMDDPEKNIDALALDKIITTLNDHNIKTIILTTPYKKSYFELQPETYSANFNVILDGLEKKHHTKIYRLDHRYENFTNIWTDFNHVALDPSVTVFNDDVGEIILKEIG